MRKVTLYGKEAREKILAGVEKISKAVSVTLGPKGRNVCISQSMVIDYGVHSLPVKITKDGYTVAREFDLDEPHEKAGVLMIKEATQKTVNEAGDGTTTCCVLAHGIVKMAVEMIERGANPVELKREIDKGVQDAVEQLAKMAVPVKGNIDRIREIATISANNDPEIGNMIADAFAKIGDEGIIDLEEGKTETTEIKIADGYKWDKSFVSPLFINNKEKQICELDNPFILLYSNRINHHKQVLPILEKVMRAGRSLLIVCEDAIEEGLAFLLMNSLPMNGKPPRIRCCVVKAPAFNDQRREEMEDLALLTGGTYVSDIRGVKIQDVELANLGQAKKVTVTKEETIIIGGFGDKEEVGNFVNELRMNLAQAKTEDEKAPIAKRIAKMNGGVAVIQVGAATETEMREKLDRYDDSVRAVKSAIAEGFIVGAGTAFLRVKTTNEILAHVLSMPLKQICENAGVDADQIIRQVRNAAGDIGYNAKTDKIENLVQAGVIDPVKVLRCALTNAASSAGMIITTEALIADTL